MLTSLLGFLFFFKKETSRSKKLHKYNRAGPWEKKSNENTTIVVSNFGASNAK